MNIGKTIQSALKHYHSGDFKQAKDLCRKIIEKQPANAEILHFLGIICAQSEEHDSAIHYLRKSLALNTNNAEGYLALGIAYNKKGMATDAINSLKKALELNPNLTDAYYYLAAICQDIKYFNEAIAYYKKLQQLVPENVRLLSNLGKLLFEQGQLDEALSCYRKALELDPKWVDGYNSLGNIFQEQEQFDASIDCYQEAMRISPTDPTAYINIGIALQNTKKYEESINYFQKALSINPKLDIVYTYIGFSLLENGKLTEASESFETALKINPDSTAALVKLGRIFEMQGITNEAETYYRRAIQIQPDHFNLYENLIMNLLYNLRYDAHDIYTEHLQFAKRFEAPLLASISSHTNDRSLDRRLKIGYVSPDFKRHSVAYFIEPVLAAHNKDQFEIFCYSLTSVKDDVTKRLHGYVEKWRDISRISDKKATELIRNDSIDILIDLAGHTAGSRILLFALKPAPLQITWIGYPSTTGLSSIDYKIVDIYTDPNGMTEQFYSEELIRMPESLICYTPDRESPQVGTLPALSSDNITFGSFNNFAKASPYILELWTEVMKSIPDSRLILKSGCFSDTKANQYVTEIFTQNDIVAERIKLLSMEVSTKSHLDKYNLIDIGLDTFPYNGTTTTCEALWMGVPVITLAGNTHASRVGMSLLSNVGLSDLIANSKDEYIKIAINLAKDLTRLQLLRERLRDMMSYSPLTDAKRFIVNLEDAYRRIWQNWCKSS